MYYKIKRSNTFLKFLQCLNKITNLYPINSTRLCNVCKTCLSQKFYENSPKTRVAKRIYIVYLI